MVIATDITAFHIIGGALAIWAVLLAAMGIVNHSFPPKGLEKVVMAISAILVVGAISSAIITGGEKKPKGGGEKGASSQEGSAQKPPASPAAETLKLSAAASGQLAFNTKTLSGKAGTIRIVMHNPAPLQHNVSLQGPNGVNVHGPTVSQNGDSQVQASLKPGKYTFYCSVPGHRQAGMQGTLTVTK